MAEILSRDQSNIGYVLDAADNVATLPWGGRVGEAVRLRGASSPGAQAPVMLNDIAPGHKVALSEILQEEPVLKYGSPIGFARHDIPAGSCVHIENVKSRFEPTETRITSAALVEATIWPDVLMQAVATVLQAAGAKPQAAKDAAQHCKSAEERGVSTHGIRRLPALVQRLRAGGIDGLISPQIERHGAVLCIDGFNGLGHHVSRVAADAVIETARETGVAVALVRNSSHFGYAGFYATHIAQAGMVGVAVSNGQVLVGPSGARRAIFSNNPFALAAPLGEDGFFEFDMATSVTSRARIMMAAETGAAIAPGMALDIEGRATTNAADALAGILLPLGGEKGFGFIAALEVLAGILPGGAYADQVVSKEAAPDRAEGTSHFLMAIAPAAFGNDETFRARLADLEHRVTNLPMAPGTGPARMPGARRAALAAECARSGIPLNRKSIEILHQLAGEAGVQVDMITKGST